jgi:hypothetical protein
VRRRQWWKTGATTNPTSLLRLTQSRFDIDHVTWFRQTLFARAAWASDIDRAGNPIQVVTINFEVTVAGAALGAYALLVDYAPHREAGQRNVTTILHWGADVGAVLRQTDYTGRTVTISRWSDGSYSLDIS